jgi:predicted HTH domain antitoxin
MAISIEIPREIEVTLRGQLGEGLEQQAKKDLAVSWFRNGRLTSRQVGELLGISLFEAHAFLKREGAPLPMSMTEVEEDLMSLGESHSS